MSVVELQRIPTVDEIVSDLLDIIRRYTKSAGESWTAATVMEETGVDSFDFVELIFEIEERYAININMNANTSANDLATVADVATMVQSTIKAERRAS